MNENIIKMLELLAQNEEAQKKFASIRDPEEAYALVSSIHGGYTKEEFIQAMASLGDQMNQDLSDEKLNSIAGGGQDDNTDDIILTIAASVVYTGGLAAAAAV